jgi:hypothetical protein
VSNLSGWRYPPLAGRAISAGDGNRSAAARVVLDG